MQVEEIINKLKGVEDKEFIVTFRDGKVTLNIDKGFILAFIDDPDTEIPIPETLFAKCEFFAFGSKMFKDDYWFLREDYVYHNLDTLGLALWRELFSDGFTVDITNLLYDRRTATERLKPISKYLAFCLHRHFRLRLVADEDACDQFDIAFTTDIPSRDILRETPLVYTFVDVVMAAVLQALETLRLRALNVPAIEEILNGIFYSEKESKIFQELRGHFKRKLFSHGAKLITVDKPSHVFVISETTQQENYRLGWLGERALFNYLKTFSPETSLEVLGRRPAHFEEATYNINWLNEKCESLKPYDIEFSFSCRYFRSAFIQNLCIEVKTTRLNEESVFFFSLNECEYMVNCNDYVVARVTFLKGGKPRYGIRIHEEFYVNFYTPKPETIQEVRNNLIEWREHYNASEIRLNLSHFDLLTEPPPEEWPYRPDESGDYLPF